MIWYSEQAWRCLGTWNVRYNLQDPREDYVIVNRGRMMALFPRLFRFLKQPSYTGLVNRNMHTAYLHNWREDTVTGHLCSDIVAVSPGLDGWVWAHRVQCRQTVLQTPASICLLIVGLLCTSGVLGRKKTLDCVQVGRCKLWIRGRPFPGLPLWTLHVP